jgi:hypothetical protein
LQRYPTDDHLPLLLTDTSLEFQENTASPDMSITWWKKIETEWQGQRLTLPLSIFEF